MLGVSRAGRVLTVELQRPERRNALNVELIDRLCATIEEAVPTPGSAGADDAIRAIVLTGQGAAFCSGIDLSAQAFAENAVEELQSRAIALNRAIDRVPVPVIAAVNGPTIGAGVPLAMICDLRVVDPSAYFQLPVARYGLAADSWTIRRLTSLVGYGRARGMLMTAEKLSAEQALACGMANRLGGLAEAQELATEIAGLAPLTLQHAKRVLNDDGSWESEEAGHRELFDRAWRSQDLVEAQVARLQKRPPVFQGA